MKKQRKNEEGISFYQSATDLMTALLLIILLVAMLLILYLVRTPHAERLDDEMGSVYEDTEPEGYTYDMPSDDDGEYDEPYEDNDGGGGDDGDGEYDEPPETEPVYGLPDNGSKSAVLVRVIDDETGSLIRKEGISFELFSAGGSLLTLHTYYPEKVSYRQYDTREDGTFYLPEKIAGGSYYLTQITEIEGYDLALKTDFEMDDAYDWDDPFIVNVNVSASKNIIRIRLTDPDTGDAIPDASFDVVAAEDITTLDGTVRYEKGTVADSVTTDEYGYAESQELYLGNYILTASEVPEYYAAPESDTDVSVEKKTDTLPEENPVNESLTTMTVALTDELTGDAIEGAEYTVTNGTSGTSDTYTTDRSGRIILSELDKDTEYTIRQQSASGDYRADTSAHSFTVSQSGQIDGSAKASLALTNRELRVSISVTDAVLQQTVPDLSVTLYSEDGAQIDSWITDSGSRTITSLTEGNYYLEINGNEQSRTSIHVRDDAAIQNVSIRYFTTTSYLVIAGVVAAGVAILAVLIIILRRRGRKKGA